MTIGVYAVMRHDLKKCYVGASLNVDQRVNQHANGPRTYIREALIDPEGSDPGIFVRACEAEALNDAEVGLWDEMEALGWEVINRSRQRGLFGGPLRAKEASSSPLSPAQHEARQRQARYLNTLPRTAAQIDQARTQAVRMSQLPRTDAQIEHARVMGTSTRTKEQRKQFRQNGRAVAALRRRCADCDLTTSPASLGRHLKASSHSGYVEVEPVTS